MSEPRLPSVLRVECKFTTGRSIELPRRELEALAVHDPDGAGVIAVLFWHGPADPNGRWLLVDAKESVRPGRAAVACLGVNDLVRLDRTQGWLAGVRRHVAENWRPFLAAFSESALAGHESLSIELGALHTEGKLRECVDGYRGEVLEVDHRSSMQAIVDGLGESPAGHVFQDLLGYLLGMAGYRIVRMNAVGVPDIELTGLQHDGMNEERFVVSFSRQQLDRAIDLAEAARDVPLLKTLRAGLLRPTNV